MAPTAPAPAPFDPSALLQDVEVAALTAILPNIVAVDNSVKAIAANQPFSFAVLQTNINNIAGQGLIIEADAPLLLPVIAGAVSAAIGGQADTSLQQVIAWIEAQQAGASSAGGGSTLAANKIRK